MNLQEIIRKKRLMSSPFGPEALRFVLGEVAKEMVMAHLPALEKELLEVATKYLKKEMPHLKGEKGEFVKGPQGVQGIRGLQGDPGKDSLIPGPPGRDGKPGKDGKDSVVPGPQGIQGNPGKDGSPDSPEQVAEKLNTLEERVDIKVIKGLRRFLQNTQKSGSKSGGGSGNWFTDNATGNGVTTAFTLTHSVASGGTAIVVLLQGQVQERTTHYTVSGKTVTFTTAPENGMAIHFWYTRT